MADAGAEFNLLEEADGVRMVWNVWPYSRLEAAKCVIPFGVMYTPAKQTTNLQVRDSLLVLYQKTKLLPPHHRHQQPPGLFINYLISNSFSFIFPANRS